MGVFLSTPLIKSLKTNHLTLEFINFHLLLQLCIKLKTYIHRCAIPSNTLLSLFMCNYTCFNSHMGLSTYMLKNIIFITRYKSQTQSQSYGCSFWLMNPSLKEREADENERASPRIWWSEESKWFKAWGNLFGLVARELIASNHE